MKNYSYSHQYIPTSELKVDTSYQRYLSESHIKKLLEKFDPGLLGTLVVSKRKDGYYVIDGQHRLYVMRKKSIDKASCNVYYGLTSMQEARLFVAFNSNRKKLSPSDIFKGRIESGDPVALDIKNTVENCGLILGINKHNATNTIVALTALENIYRQLGKSGLRRVLNLIKSTWNGDPDSFDHHMLNGMKIFVHKAGDLFTDSEFISKLRKTPVIKILQDGKFLSNGVSTATYSYYAQAILKYYNANRSSKRIPEKVFFND
jgi:hypothetical protein